MADTTEGADRAPFFCWLEDRGVIALGGPDRHAFLQGLVSNDVTKAGPGRAIWAAFLTPQGKYLHDFFLVEHEDVLLLETERARLPDLLKRLKLYRLRSQVTLEDASERWEVAAVWGRAAAKPFGVPEAPGSAGYLPDAQALAFVDPRHAGLGLRVLQRGEAALPGLIAGDRSAWESLRIGLGLPDGSRDMEVEKAILLENGFDELGGVDWHKGCYMGQELTARTYYRGLIKKRLLPIESEGEIPPDATILEQEGREVGALRSRQGRRALALVRLQALADGAGLTVAGQAVRVLRPDWVVLTQPEETAS